MSKCSRSSVPKNPMVSARDRKDTADLTVVGVSNGSSTD
jgi:hypothetical protein